jgi:hypothetical protein
MKKRVRLPGPKDLDKHLRTRVVVKDRHGRQKVRFASAVDAREIIMHGCGTLDVPGELAEEHQRQQDLEGRFEQHTLKELREFCKVVGIPSVGKPASELRRLLLAKGFTPPDTETDNTVEVDVDDDEASDE